MDEPIATASASPLLTERASCPGCHGTTARRLIDLPFSDGPLAAYLNSFYAERLAPSRLESHHYQLDACDECGLLFQRQVPTTTFLSELYDDLAIGDDAVVRADRGLPVRRGYAHDVEQLINYWKLPPKDLSVLDYGAGFGLWLQMASAFGCRTTAAEFSPTKARLAQSRGDQVISTGAVPEKSYHFINAEQVVEHLVDPLEVTRSLARALVPGGLLRISVPNGTSIEACASRPDWTIGKGQMGSLNAIAPLEHLNCFTNQSLVALGTRAGLEVFHYPLRQFLARDQRLRFIASALLHRVRRPLGTLVYFRRAS
jgi:SAM-dependent methyltransferase